MTLISAFSGAIGMVFLCDSQETISGYAKKSVEKLSHRESEFPFAIAGSGDGIHVDGLTFAVTGELLELKQYDLNDIHAVLKKSALEYFKEYIWPRGSERPALELLIMTHRKGAVPDLWHIVDGVALWVENGERSLGIGSYLADYLAGKLQSFRHDEAEAIAVAAYILKETKDHIDGVGLDSTVYLFRPDGSVEYFFQETLSKLDSILVKFDTLISHVLNSTFNLQFPIDGGQIEQERQELRQEFMQFVSDAQQEAKRLGYRSIPFRELPTGN